jgi:hypothetical protein
MYKATQNFAYQGKTYFVGNKVPADIAKGLPAELVQAPKAATTTNEDTLEGDK